LTVPGSVMVDITRILPAHVGQRRASTPYVLRSSTADSTREDAAYSSPSRRRRQCWMERIVGSSEATATARRPDAPGVGCGAGITAAAAAAAAIAASVVAAAPACGGAWVASFASSFAPACGVKRGGTGTGVVAALGAPACPSSLHAFDFFVAPRHAVGRLRRHPRPPRRARTEDAVVADEREVRRRYEDRETAQEFHRRHHAMGLASARRLVAVRDAPILHQLDAFEGEGRARTGADEALAPRVVAGLDAHRAVDVEAVVRRREARRLAVQVFVAGALFGSKGPAHERAAPEREAREGVDGRVGGRLVAKGLGGALVEVLVPAQPDERPIVHALGDKGDVGLRRRRRLMGAYTLAVLLEDGIDGQQVASAREGSSSIQNVGEKRWIPSPRRRRWRGAWWRAQPPRRRCGPTP
jgi:hypothetical protein